MWTNFYLLLAEFRPCEGDQPLPKPKGWTPTLFSFWCGSVGAVPLNIKSKGRTAKAVPPTKINLQSVYNCAVFFRYLLQLLTLYRTVAVYHRSALIRKQCRPERHLIVRPEHHRQI